MTDPRIAVLAALSSPDWHPVPEAHGMPWDEAEALLAAYDASRDAASAAVVSPPPDRVTAIYDALVAFQREHRIGGGLGHAQIRALLAEHLARTLPAAPAAVSSAPADRAAVSAKLWAVAEHHIVAEWICCEPLDPKHDLCAKGYAALGMAKTLLVDSPEAWNPAAPLLDAVLAETEQLRRDRGLAIAHDRQPYPTAWAYEQACKTLHKHRDRAEQLSAVLREVLDEFGDLTGTKSAAACVESETAARWRAVLAEAEPAAVLRRVADETPQPETEAQFGAPGCTCMPWTRRKGGTRYLGPGDTVDQISGWDVRPDCPHHWPAVGAQQPKETRLICPGSICGEDITDYAEDDRVFRTGDDRPYCSSECVIAAHRIATEQQPKEA